MKKVWTLAQNQAYAGVVSAKHTPAKDWICMALYAATAPLHAKRRPQNPDPKLLFDHFPEIDGRSETEREFCGRAAKILRKREAQLAIRHAAILSIIECAPGYDGAPC